MKHVAFIADFYANEILGGGENNDANLISHLRLHYNVTCYKSKEVQIKDLNDKDAIVVGNFLFIPPEVKEYLKSTKKYIIYEHDHKYVNTRDPSKFPNFLIPPSCIIFEDFYTSANTVVVLSEICKQVLEKNINNVNVKNIGCSLWSQEKLKLLTRLSHNPKTKDLCIMYSQNATKNYPSTVEYCKKKNLLYDAIPTQAHVKFLTEMSQYKRFLFIPTVLETFSRICAEAKMMNLDVMTNKTKIGFFSEEISSLKGVALIDALHEKNNHALQWFVDCIEEM